MAPPPKNRLLERLVAEKLITPEQQEATLNVIARTGDRVEEALLELGDIHAFAALDRDAHAQFTTMLDVFERNLVSEESLTMSLAREATTGERVLTMNDMEHAGKAPGARGRGALDDAHLETFNVLVSL